MISHNKSKKILLPVHFAVWRFLADGKVYMCNKEIDSWRVLPPLGQSLDMLSLLPQNNRVIRYSKPGSQTRGRRRPCSPRGHFVRPAMFFGNFQIINIYVIYLFLGVCMFSASE